MANRPFDRTIINVRERPLSSDINQAQSQLDFEARQIEMQRNRRRSGSSTADAAGVPEGFVADGFKPDAGPGYAVTLRAGLGWQNGTGDQPSSIGGVSGLDDLSPYKPVELMSSQLLPWPAPDGANPRIDIIEVKYDRRVENLLGRDVLNTFTGQFVPTVVSKTLGVALDGLTSVDGTNPINIKRGTAAANPTEPSVDAGYMKIGAVYVPVGAASLTNLNVVDRRVQVGGPFTVGVSIALNTATGFFVANTAVISAPPGWQVQLLSAPLYGLKSVSLYVLPPSGLLTLSSTPIWHVSGADPFFSNVQEASNPVVVNFQPNITVTQPSDNTALGAATDTYPNPFNTLPGFANGLPTNFGQLFWGGTAVPLRWNNVGQQFDQTLLHNPTWMTFTLTFPGVA